MLGRVHAFRVCGMFGVASLIIISAQCNASSAGKWSFIVYCAACPSVYMRSTIGELLKANARCAMLRHPRVNKRTAKMLGRF